MAPNRFLTGKAETCPSHPAQSMRSLRTVGLFSGIAGIERGLHRHGHSATVLCEIDPICQEILRAKFPEANVIGDVRALRCLPTCDLVSAGFPCQDLSQCGRMSGITGQHSSLIREVFRLVGDAQSKPEWLLLENVPFMLSLDRGRAMTFITSELKRLGYRWAYRTVDARAFGLPQRRLRVVLVAAMSADPREVLFADNVKAPLAIQDATGYGFYWTEGSNGLGWGVDCVPTLKGGSGIGIPSPPAIWIPAQRRIITIDIRDAERLQGFPTDWTKPAERIDKRPAARWRLVGNAVSVRVAAWIGKRLGSPRRSSCELGAVVNSKDKWPKAAYGDDREIRAVVASTWPVSWRWCPILEFLRHPGRPLSARATAGFLSRARISRLTFAENFLADLEHHLRAQRKIECAQTKW